MVKYGKDGILFKHVDSYATVDMIVSDGNRQTVEVISVRAGEYVSVQIPSEIPHRFYIKQLNESQYDNFTRIAGGALCS